MSRSFICFVVVLQSLCAGVASAQPERPSQVWTVADGVRRVLYTVKIKGKPDDTIAVRVPRNSLPGVGERATATGCTPPTGPEVDSDAFTWRCTMQGTEADLSFAVSGPADETTVSLDGVLKISLAGAESTFRNVKVLASSENPFVQAVFGGGIAILRDDHEDFAVKDNTLLVSNDSKKRASGLAGALFRLGNVPTVFGPKQLSMMVSFQFTEGTTALLDGVFFGGAFELNRYLHLTAGAGVRKGKELSPGFRQTAAETIQAQVAANSTVYRRFEGYGPESDDKMLDGLSLLAPGSTEKPARFFPGDPIVDSYNWSFFVGVSVPVKITDILGGKKK